MTLDDLLNVPYVADGRSQHGADCYGLTRLARVHLFGKPWMPMYGNVMGSDKSALTKAVQEESANYRECRPHAGAIAIAWRGSLCTHIAIVVEVDGKPMILETNEPGKADHGPRLVGIRPFEQRFLRVIYYDD